MRARATLNIVNGVARLDAKLEFQFTNININSIL
jgi:hypothetical protein